MSSISYSNYAALRRCGQYYKLSVLDKVPTSPQVHFEFGSALHAGINTALETRDSEQAFDVFDAYWESAVGKLDFAGERFGAGELQEMGRKFVTNFQKRLGSKMKFIVGEKRMYAPWVDPLICKLEGTPDALVEWESKRVLLDFKTSAYNYQTEKTDISLQLNLYAYLLSNNGFYVDALSYLVFNKGSGSIQTPYIVQYDAGKAERMIAEMVSYFKRNSTYHERNLTSCIMGKNICPYLQECMNEQPQTSREPHTEEAEADAGLR